MISFIVPVEGNDSEFAIGIGRRVGVVTWDGKSATAKVTRLVGQVEQDDHKYKTNRFNDGKADPKGRLFAGKVKVLVYTWNIFLLRKNFSENSQNKPKEKKLTIENVSLSKEL